MDTKRREQFRQQLLELREEIKAVDADSAESSDVVTLDQQRFGRLSRQDALQQQAMGQATRQRRAERIKSINAALERIEADEYGYCLECGEDIDERRLAFDPAATLCIDCAEAEDRDE